ncbi:ubiquinone menaquinone biosynthesis-related protein [Grosmannia clavigera kw1407]|uniref:Ubiquinone menaquinone biosynthesis-related protein n=1 Tax=Grosmannia clavigera (strain kw1407 / UAMH 11150) TaxID=655863 RepID=F0XCA9_GROCL|nr:ubiquinone menaquinone biosynthesis-related protein [Grosmannia clavigera kw1407]EFX04044.1 ubiquinone menaquinone biosynthesis-related protein [Grosmannia clavigera kw1407]
MPLLVTYLTGGCNDDDSAAATEHNHNHSSDSVPSSLPPMDAAAFDASLDVPERMMGITQLRRQLAAEAQGDVLEVAVGTGRNLGYYSWDSSKQDPHVTSFTGVDLSADALTVARRRLRSSVPGAKAVIRKRPLPQEPTAAAADAVPIKDLPVAVLDVLDSRLRLLRADAMQPLPLPSSSSPAYDTVVQTFGLCSVADPVALLAHMAAVLRPDTGRILLLEHGRGRWSVVNSLLDRYASRHFSRFGCWWNRDIDAILANAATAVPGLEVVAVSRPGWFQFGTLWWVELRVNAA